MIVLFRYPQIRSVSTSPRVNVWGHTPFCKNHIRQNSIGQTCAGVPDIVRNLQTHFGANKYRGHHFPALTSLFGTPAPVWPRLFCLRWFGQNAPPPLIDLCFLRYCIWTKVIIACVWCCVSRTRDTRLVRKAQLGFFFFNSKKNTVCRIWKHAILLIFVFGILTDRPTYYLSILTSCPRQCSHCPWCERQNLDAYQ